MTGETVNETGPLRIRTFSTPAGTPTISFSGSFPDGIPNQGFWRQLRARIANPMNVPDQFHAKKGDFHTRISGKAIYGVILAIRAQSCGIKIHLPALTSGRNKVWAYSSR